MSSQHFVGKVCLKAILVKDGKALITHDAARPDLWELPGGRLHVGEDIEEALKREFMEELGVALAVGPLVYSEQYLQTTDGSPHLLLAYEVHLQDENQPFAPSPTEVVAMKWIDLSTVNEQKLYQNCLNALLAYWKR